MWGSTVARGSTVAWDSGGGESACEPVLRPAAMW